MLFTWRYAHTITASIEPEKIWAAYADVATWPIWDTELETCRLEGPFAVGSRVPLTPKGGREVIGTLTICEPNKRFVDVTKLPLATLTFDHVLEPTPAGLKITHTVVISGPLTFLWRRIIGSKIERHLAAAMQQLVVHAKRLL